MTIRHFVGVDLGQVNDWAAIAIVEQTWRPSQVLEGVECSHYAVTHLDRLRQTPYPQIVKLVSDLVRLPQIMRPVLAVDATGVGRPVVDLFVGARLPCSVLPITFTGGTAVTQAMGGGYNVPKRDLAMGLLTLMQQDRLKIGNIHLRDELDEEMQAFRVKVTANAHETFEALRASDHDDLVMALALAVWAGQIHTNDYNRPLICSSPKDNKKDNDSVTPRLVEDSEFRQVFKIGEIVVTFDDFEDGWGGSPSFANSWGR